MRKLHCLLTLSLMAASGAGIAATARLDTGYNHSVGAYYGTGNSTDNYWIKIASYEPPAGSVNVAPAFIYHWWTPVAGPTTVPAPGGVKALGPRLSAASSSGTNISNKAYSIYRKCFCLLSTQGASLNFRVRGDDQVMAWLNSVSNILAGPGFVWSSSAPSLQSGPTNEGMFREGRNCVYVLVEDFWGATGFSLHGQVTAPGLMPTMAAGVEASFGGCPCPEPTSNTAALAEQAAVVEMMRRAERARKLPATPEAPPISSPGEEAPPAGPDPASR